MASRLLQSSSCDVHPSQEVKVRESTQWDQTAYKKQKRCLASSEIISGYDRASQ